MPQYVIRMAKCQAMGLFENVHFRLLIRMIFIFGFKFKIPAQDRKALGNQLSDEIDFLAQIVETGVNKDLNLYRLHLLFNSKEDPPSLKDTIVHGFMPAVLQGSGQLDFNKLPPEQFEEVLIEAAIILEAHSDRELAETKLKLFENFIQQSAAEWDGFKKAAISKVPMNGAGYFSVVKFIEHLPSFSSEKMKVMQENKNEFLIAFLAVLKIKRNNFSRDDLLLYGEKLIESIVQTYIHKRHVKDSPWETFTNWSIKFQPIHLISIFGSLKEFEILHQSNPTAFLCNDCSGLAPIELAEKFHNYQTLGKLFSLYQENNSLHLLLVSRGDQGIIWRFPKELRESLVKKGNVNFPEARKAVKAYKKDKHENFKMFMGLFMAIFLVLMAILSFVLGDQIQAYVTLFLAGGSGGYTCYKCSDKSKKLIADLEKIALEKQAEEAPEEKLNNSNAQSYAQLSQILVVSDQRSTSNKESSQKEERLEPDENTPLVQKSKLVLASPSKDEMEDFSSGMAKK